MFIDPVRRKRRSPTPSGVHVYRPGAAEAAHPVRGDMSNCELGHGTPDGVRLLVARLAITMALLTECGGDGFSSAHS